VDGEGEEIQSKVVAGIEVEIGERVEEEAGDGISEFVMSNKVELMEVEGGRVEEVSLKGSKVVTGIEVGGSEDGVGETEKRQMVDNVPIPGLVLSLGIGGLFGTPMLETVDAKVATRRRMCMIRSCGMLLNWWMCVLCAFVDRGHVPRIRDELEYRSKKEEDRSPHPRKVDVSI
jgi:hypothetical protein